MGKEKLIDLFAFWEYFDGRLARPLGGQIKLFNDEGKAYIPYYYAWVKPIAIFPVKKGKEIEKEIKKLEQEFHNKSKDLAEEYEQKIRDLIK